MRARRCSCSSDGGDWGGSSGGMAGHGRKQLADLLPAEQVLDDDDGYCRPLAVGFGGQYVLVDGARQRLPHAAHRGKVEIVWMSLPGLV